MKSLLILGDKANPVGLTIGTRGEVTHAHRLIPQQRGKTSVITAAKIRQKDIRILFLFSLYLRYCILLLLSLSFIF
jgi:hypothetical protein